jgi:hypothetical protein
MERLELDVPSQAVVDHHDRERPPRVSVASSIKQRTNQSFNQMTSVIFSRS